MLDKIKLIKNQFLRGIQVDKIDFQDVLQEISWDEQRLFFNHVFMNEKNQKFPLRKSYQVSLIKMIIQKLEETGNEEIFDGFYENLTNLLKSDEEEFSYKHFLITDDIYITFKESNSFIRDGTTGLKLWPASNALSDYIMSNRNYFDGKSILELGSGASGYVGLTLLKATKAATIYLSDCHDVVIRNLIENVNLNLQDEIIESHETSILIRQRLKINNSINFGILSLPFEDIDEHISELTKICIPNDVLLAADVIYDESIFVPLLKCLNALFKINGTHPLEFILSQTIRNENTFHKFCDLLSENSFNIIELPDNNKDVKKFPCDALSLSNSDENVKILKITKC